MWPNNPIWNGSFKSHLQKDFIKNKIKVNEKCEYVHDEQGMAMTFVCLNNYFNLNIFNVIII